MAQFLGNLSTACCRNCVACSGGTESVSSRWVTLRAHAHLLVDHLQSLRSHCLLAAFHREDKPTQQTQGTLQVTFCNCISMDSLAIWTFEHPDVTDCRPFQYSQLAFAPPPSPAQHRRLAFFTILDVCKTAGLFFAGEPLHWS